MTPPRVTGVLLAAGRGRRYGRPKAVLDTGSGPWVTVALGALGGCATRVVVAGPLADEVAAAVGDRARTVVNHQHDTGMAGSLALGLAAAAQDGPDAVMVMLVDLPDVTRAVADRLVAALPADPAAARTALLRAAYQGSPGHPVLIGADHLPPLLEALRRGDPDTGAGGYLTTRGSRTVECGDLATGADVDVPAARA